MSVQIVFNILFNDVGNVAKNLIIINIYNNLKITLELRVLDSR